jgi:hypothetical protein
MDTPAIYSFVGIDDFKSSRISFEHFSYQAYSWYPNKSQLISQLEMQCLRTGLLNKFFYLTKDIYQTGKNQRLFSILNLFLLKHIVLSDTNLVTENTLVVKNEQGKEVKTC